MKIAILTQPLGHNYGGMMQAYALQKVLRNLGHEVITIDYKYPEVNLFYKAAKLPYRLVKKLAGKRKAPINLEAKLPYIQEYTRQFIAQNIILSEYIDNETALSNHFDSNNYDVVIVGSDQTWRPKYSPNIYNFYLDFLKQNKDIRKVTYAASFGVDNWEYSDEQTARCAKLASLFDAISVREESGVELCRRRLKVDSECVLDPTLLLTKESYIELLGDKYNPSPNKGVFTYILDKNESKMAAAEHISKQLDSNLFQCQANSNGSSLVDYKMPAVQDWLASFANAEFVVTDSFHGMVFSIVFEKPFLVIANNERGAARFQSLLKQIDSIEYLVNDPDFIISGELDIKAIRPLNLTKVSVKRQESMLFLNKELKAI